MTQEVARVDQNYSTLRTKVDIVANVVIKFFEFYNSLVTKVDLKSEFDSTHFDKLEELIGSMKEFISKIYVSPSSSVSNESSSKMFSLFKSNLRADLTPLIKFVNFMPTDAPPVKTGV